MWVHYGLNVNSTGYWISSLIPQPGKIHTICVFLLIDMLGHVVGREDILRCWYIDILNYRDLTDWPHTTKKQCLFVRTVVYSESSNSYSLPGSLQHIWVMFGVLVENLNTKARMKSDGFRQRDAPKWIGYKVVPPQWCECWFINPMNYSYKYDKA